MKFNNKVLAIALALSMGFGAVTPAKQAFAVDSQSYIEADTYKTTGDKWLEAYKNLKVFTDKKESLEKEYTDAQKIFFDKRDEIEKNKKEQDGVNKEANKKINDLQSKLDITGPDTEAYLKGIEEIKNTESLRGSKLNDLKTLLSALEVEKKQAEEKMAKANKDLKTDYEYTDNYGRTQKASLDNVIKALKDIENNKKEAFKKAGGTEEEMEAILKSDKVVVPSDRTQENEIRETVKRLEMKMSGLDYIKKFMPESVKRYQKEIDSATKSVEKSLKQAKDYLESLEK